MSIQYGPLRYLPTFGSNIVFLYPEYIIYQGIYYFPDLPAAMRVPVNHNPIVYNNRFMVNNQFVNRNAPETNERPRRMHCSFCYGNEEFSYVVRSHNLRERINGKMTLTCPVLRRYVCPTCNATGDDAHTVSYCPQRKLEEGVNPTPVAVLIKNSRYNTCGRLKTRRYR